MFSFVKYWFLLHLFTEDWSFKSSKKTQFTFIKGFNNSLNKLQNKCTVFVDTAHAHLAKSYWFRSAVCEVVIAGILKIVNYFTKKRVTEIDPIAENI